MPTMAKVIMVLVILGKLKERMVSLKISPPKKMGSHPKAKIMSELVAQEWNPSVSCND